MILKLKKFIKLNGLTFKEGVRNKDCVIISGYALYIGASYADVCGSIPLKARTGELGIEIERIFKYAEANNYGAWWEVNEKLARTMYKF